METRGSQKPSPVGLHELQQGFEAAHRAHVGRRVQMGALGGDVERVALVFIQALNGLPGTIDGNDDRRPRQPASSCLSVPAAARETSVMALSRRSSWNLSSADADAVRNVQPAAAHRKLRRLGHEGIHKLRLRNGRRLRQRHTRQHRSRYHHPPCSARPSIPIHRTPQCIQRTAYAIGDSRARGDAPPQSGFRGNLLPWLFTHNRSQTSCETASQV